MPRNIPFDESVRLRELQWQKGPLPRLYIDGYTIMTEVADISKLQEGDHCVVGLPHAVFRGLSPMIDSLCASVTSWDAQPIPAFHHFIILDTVASVGAYGPLSVEGAPVRVAEYSETLRGSWRRFVADGYNPQHLLANIVSIAQSPASFHASALKEYLPSFPRIGGVMVVSRERTASQRRETRDAALALLQSEAQPEYRLFSSNCEHAAFSLDSTLPRWVSPQVPYLLWGLFRYSLQLVGIAFLHVFAVVPPSYVRIRLLLESLYHFFSTVPLAFAIQAQCVRAVVNLTTRRRELGLCVYNFLVVKEVVRACLTGILCVGAAGLVPGFVRQSGRVHLACVIAIFSFGAANLLFNVGSQVTTRCMIALGLGVPTLMFDDLRDTAAALQPKLSPPIPSHRFPAASSCQDPLPGWSSGANVQRPGHSPGRVRERRLGSKAAHARGGKRR